MAVFRRIFTDFLVFIPGVAWCWYFSFNLALDKETFERNKIKYV